MTFPLDWLQYKTQGSTDISIDQSTPIIGHGSLTVNTIAADRVTLHNTTYINGLLLGTMQSIFKITTHTSVSRAYTGFVFMQDNPDVSLITSVGYGVFFSSLSGLTSSRISIVKFTTGLPASPTELAFTTAFTPPTLGSNFVLSAIWTSSFAGTSIIVEYATGTSFLNLLALLNVNDSVSPIVTTSYESLAVSSTGTGTYNVLFDETSIFEIF